MIKIVSYRWMQIASVFIGGWKNPANAQSLLGLPIIIYRDKSLLTNKRLLNHEMIHFHQAALLLFVPFWIIYVGHFVVNLVRYCNSDRAYRNICFEREAYANDENLQYLIERKPYAWIHYF